MHHLSWLPSTILAKLEKVAKPVHLWKPVSALRVQESREANSGEAHLLLANLYRVGSAVYPDDAKLFLQLIDSPVQKP